MAPKPTQRKGELTRADLIEAARTVFGRVGYLGAEISLIAREAGKSIGVFYIYFQNKDELLATLVDDFRAELHQSLHQPLHAPEELHNVLSALWHIYKNHAATFVALTEAAATVPMFAEISWNLRKLARNDFAHMIMERQKRDLSSGLDPVRTSEAIETMINYCLYEWLAKGSSGFRDEREEAAALNTLVAITQRVMLA